MPAADNSGSVGGGGGSSDVSGDHALGLPMEDEGASSDTGAHTPLKPRSHMAAAAMGHGDVTDEDVANNNREGDEDDDDEVDMDVEVNKENGEDDDMDTSNGGGEKTSTNARNSNVKVSEQLKEQLQTISSTIGQLSNSISNCNSGPKSVQELAVLQATLFSLQQQQLLQMQILSQMSRKESGGDDLPENDLPLPPAPPALSANPLAELAKKMQLAPTFNEEKKRPLDVPEMPWKPRPPPPNESSPLPSTPIPPTITPKSVASLTGGGGSSLLSLPPAAVSTPEKREEKSVTPFGGGASEGGGSLSSQILDPNAPSSLASSIIIHHDDGKADKQPPVNSLELLQKRAQGILNNASQGLLSNNLADFTANKDREDGKKGGGGEPFFKHRCRYQLSLPDFYLPGSF